MATVKTMKKILLGREIEHMMVSAGKRPADLEAILATSRARVSNILDGKGTISIGDVERLARQLGFDDAGYHEFLFDLAQNAHKRGYWNTGHRRAYSENVRQRVDAESLVDRLRDFEVEVWTGLLQEEGYARGVHAGLNEPDAKGLTTEDHVAARLARRAILFKEPNPPQAHFIMSESCMARVRCDRPAMIEQIEGTIRHSQRPNIFVQILPFDQPVNKRTSVSNRFTLMRIPNAGATGPLEFVFTEEEGVGMRYSDERTELDRYDQRWDRLTASALTYAESRDFMREWKNRLKKTIIT